MRCTTCHTKNPMVEIRMKIAGEDVTFCRCGRCESKSWMTEDGPLALQSVLELARVAR
jgi:hypothetical protein